MDFITHSHRHGEIILQEKRYKKIWNEVKEVIRSVTDDDLINTHSSYYRLPKSLSRAINDVLKERFLNIGWNCESPIFQDDIYNDNRWRLDFAKDCISIEVAFNHGEAIAWNLMKPVLASELNHVEKAIQTDIGIFICATRNLKDQGGFDGSVGEFEKVMTYLKPFNNFLTVPMVVIGLEAPQKFFIEVVKNDRDQKEGRIVLN